MLLNLNITILPMINMVILLMIKRIADLNLKNQLFELSINIILHGL